MKKLLAIIMCLLMTVGMAACASEIQKVDLRGRYSTYIDEETGVNYMIYFDSNGGGICPRYNADGTLYVSEVE